MITLREKYKKEIRSQLKEILGYKNIMQVPRLKKVVINIGLGKGLKDPKFNESAAHTIRRITGQQPVYTLAKKSISNFKTRKGLKIGLKVTLRGEKMYSFVSRLVHNTFPRVRDFRGIDEKNVDGNGNLNVGFKEHIAFPEIKSDEIERIHGLQVTIVTDSKTRKEGLELFKKMGIPFKKD